MQISGLIPVRVGGLDLPNTGALLPVRGSGPIPGLVTSEAYNLHVLSYRLLICSLSMILITYGI